MPRPPFLSVPTLVPFNPRRLGPAVGLGLTIVLATAFSCKEDAGRMRTDLTISEANSVTFMREPVKRSYEAVKDAQQFLNRDQPDVDAAKMSLQVAGKALAEVNLYYMPATEARGQMLNAYREQIAGRSDERDRCLADAREELDGIMRRSGPELEKSTKKLSEMIDRIAMRIRLGEPINEELEGLIELSNLQLLNAPLVLGAESFREPEN